MLKLKDYVAYKQALFWLRLFVGARGGRERTL